MSATAAPNLLEIRDLAIDIAGRNGPIRVVDGISFGLAPGEALGVVGESGCGKSLTLLSLLGLLPNRIGVTGGTAHFRGRDLFTLPKRELQEIRGGEIGFIFQDPMTSLNPVMRVGRQLMEPLFYHRKLSATAARARAIELLRLVGIPGPEQRIESFPHEMSGGMRQRVMIAMALACDPVLLIADEPTTALDVTIQAQVVDLIKEFKQRLGMSIIWITHDLALVAGLVDRVVVLYAGVVVEDAPVEALYANPQHPYTRGLLASIPQLSGAGHERLNSIGGAPPEPGRRPVGCPFAPRCSLAMPVCRTQTPQLLPANGHRVACFAVSPPAEGIAA
jgi:peptide/nickel transport system ATP-binding protein